MAINEKFSEDNGYNNPFGAILAGTAIVTPIGVGGLYGLRNLSSNNAIDPARMGVSTPLGRMGRSVGAKLRSTDAAARTKREAASLAFAKKMVESKGIQGLIAEAENQAAVIQSMIGSLDDPESGISSGAMLGFKARLQNVSEELSKKADIKDTLVALFSEMYSSNTPALEVFRSRLSDYKRIGAELEIPTFSTTIADPFQQIESNLSPKAQQRFNRIKGIVGRYSGFDKSNLHAYQVREADGTLSQYARIYAGQGDSRRLLSTVPLHLNVNNNKTGGGYNVIRTGARATSYTADQRLIDGPAALKALREHGSVGRDALAKANALLDPEDYLINILDNNYQGGMSLKHMDRYNNQAAEILTNEPRFARMNSPLGQHVRNLTRLQANTARFLGLEGMSKSERSQLLRAASQSNEYDLGSGPDRLAEQMVNGRISFAVMMNKGSAFSAMKTGFGSALPKNRTLEPIVARLEQVWNRLSEASMYTTKNNPLGKGGVFQSGSTFTGSGNILWDDEFTGGANRAFILDVGHGRKGKGGRLWRGLEDKGFAYSTRADTVTKGFTIPVADPKAHGSFASKILNKVMGANGGWVEFSPEELREHKSFLAIGTGPESRFIPLDPRTKKVRLRYQETTKSAGNQAIHLLGEIDREMDAQKIFAREFKGSIDQISAQQAQDLLSGYNVSSEFLHKQFGINVGDSFIGSGEMFKKSPHNWMRQMSSSFALATGRKDSEQLLEAAANALKGNVSLGMGLIDEKASNPIALATVATMRSLKEQGVSAKAAGHVMSLVYQRGLSDTDSWLRGENAGLVMDADSFNKLANHLWGASSKEFFDAAESGLMLTAGTYMQGQGVGDWGRARASIEPRFIEMLQFRLRSTGMSEGNISDILTKLIQRKAGIGAQITLTDELTSMLHSAKGLPGVDRDAPMHTLKSLFAAMEEAGIQDLNKFLQTQDKGIFLNMAGDLGDKSQVFEQALKATGNTQPLYISGKAGIDSMRGTFIKVAEGESSLDIGNDYERMVKAFGEDLRDLHGINSPSTERIQSVMGQYNANLTGLTAKSFQQLASGKIKGSAFIDAYNYDLDAMTNLTDSQAGLIRRAMKKSHNSAVFLDSAGFINQLDDAGSEIDKTRSLARFFTGLEGVGDGSISGIASLSSRNPILSTGGVSYSETFRNVHEVGLSGDQDAIFKQIKESEWGKRALGRFQNPVGSFADVARSSDRKARTLLFRDFTRNLKSFSGTGGGRAYFPTQRVGMTLSDGSTMNVDMGLATGAGGDFDGDKFGHYLLDSQSSKRLMRHMSAAESAKLIVDFDNRFKTSKAIYTEQAKIGLNNFAKKVGYQVGESAFQDALKEKASKEATGIVDDALNDLRRNVLNYGDSLAGNDALALLDVLEEHTTIKGKKVPIYYPFAEQLAASITTMTKSGNTDAFKETLAFIFQGSGIAGEGLSVSSMSDAAFADSVKGHTIKLSTDIDTIVNATAASKTFSRGALGATAKRIGSAVSYANERLSRVFNDFFYSDSSFQAGVVASGRTQAQDAVSTATSVMSQVGDLLDSGNRRLMGGLAVGTIAAVAASSMFGQNSEPLVMDTELAGVQQQEPMIDPSNMGGGGSSSYDMMQRPIQPATTFMKKNNTYQMHGESNSGGSLSQMIGYLGSSHNGSQANITINDARHPITSSYLDRLTGEY